MCGQVSIKDAWLVWDVGTLLCSKGSTVPAPMEITEVDQASYSHHDSLCSV